MPGFSVMNNEVPIKQRSCVDACFLRFDARILVRFPAASLMSQAMNPDKRRIRNESRSCNRNSRRTRLKKRDYLRFRIRQSKGFEVAMKSIVGGQLSRIVTIHRCPLPRKESKGARIAHCLVKAGFRFSGRQTWFFSSRFHAPFNCDGEGQRVD